MPARKNRPDKFGTFAHVPAMARHYRESAERFATIDPEHAESMSHAAERARVEYLRYTLKLVVCDPQHPMVTNDAEHLARQDAALARMREAGVLDETRTSKAHKGCTSCRWHIIDARTGDDLDGSEYATTVESWVGEHFTAKHVRVVPVVWDEP